MLPNMYYAHVCVRSCDQIINHQLWVPAIKCTRRSGFVCHDEGFQLLSGKFLMSLDDFGVHEWDCQGFR